MAVVIADTACVHPRAELEDEVEIGPYCVIGPEVRIGRGTQLVGHVYVPGPATIGRENRISPFTVVGGEPLDRAAAALPTVVEIGDGNILREGVTIHRGSSHGEGKTRIGSDNHLMAHVHVAQDGWLGDGITLCQGVVLESGVRVESHAHVAVGVNVHSLVTIGECSFVAGSGRVHGDVPRYMLVEGSSARVRCLNSVALKRRRLSKEGLHALHEAHRLIYRARTELPQAAEILTARGHFTPEVRSLFEFLQAQQEGRHGRARERLRLQADLVAEPGED
jgi:UDP-N-acetylglucosamine acyltransferase